MSDYDRDGNVERQQIHEIALNVARRLLKVLEIGRSAPPALAAEIDATARVISDIQQDVEQVMAMQPFGAALDMSVLTHILGSQQYAVGLLEQLEKRTQGYGPAATATPVPNQAYSFSGNFGARQSVAGSQDFSEAERVGEDRRFSQPRSLADAQHFSAAPVSPKLHPHNVPFAPATYPAAPEPQQHWTQVAPGLSQPAMQPNNVGHGAASHGGPAPYYSGPAPQRSHGTLSRSANQSRPPQTSPRQRPGAATRSAAMKPAFSLPDFAALAARMSEPKFAAAAATLVVVTASVIGALTLLPGPSAEKHGNVAPGQKLDGRLDADMAAPTVHKSPEQQFAAVAHDPNSMEQPYLVVLATRASTEELQSDFQGFNTAYPDLLSGRKARVDRIQGQDQKTWHRLSLIPPQSQADAKELCAKLKAAGLTGCWIRRVPLSK
jgi:hypothetical protein